VTKGAESRVLVVEDGSTQADLTAAILREEGFEPTVCATGAEAIELLDRGGWLAVTLDWSLPDMNGLTLCRHIRETDPLVPIMFISGHADEANLARAFDAGADDYLVKPFRVVEFTARLEARLRKARLISSHSKPVNPDAALPTEVVLRFGELEIDTEAHEVRILGQSVELGQLEYRLVEFLARASGIAQSRQAILGSVHGIKAEVGLNRVDVLVGRVRSKLGNSPGAKPWITTVPGFWFRWERIAG